MKAFPYMPVSCIGVVQLEKLMPANPISKCLALGIGINFPLSYRQGLGDSSNYEQNAKKEHDTINLDTIK